MRIISTCIALPALCRFRRQYCSRRSNYDKYTLFLYFLNFSQFSERFLKADDFFRKYAHANTSCMLHYLKRLCVPFSFSSERYLIPFYSLQREISYRMQNPKIHENKRILHAVVENLPAACKMVVLEQLQKVIKYPLEQIARGICELYATPIILAIYR